MSLTPGAGMDAFKTPQDIPQDLLLIHEIIGVPTTSAKSQKTVEAVADTEDCIDSSDSDNASEDEIEADLTALNYEEERPKSLPESDSSSQSGSESEFDASDAFERISATLDLDEDEEGGPTPALGIYFQTKNEVVEADISIPEIAEVGPEEVLEKVGQIATIMGNTVIVSSVPSEVAERGSERALDSDTLLIFENRNVMGYIYETFGPTCQPLYQVKFNNEFPLDPGKIRISREVFHVPAQSNFVFLSHLKTLKGSDASNVHDEEPAENELEFSDDEAEAAYKASLKRKRGESRSHSVAASSRQSTPTPSQIHDQDMADTSHLSRNPYDEHGPYDVGFTAGPSRPPPIPYDDPYSDSYTSMTSQQAIEPRVRTEVFDHRPYQQHDSSGSPGRARDQGRDRSDRGDGKSRGRGRGRGRGQHGGLLPAQPRSGMSRTRRESNAGRPMSMQNVGSSYGQHTARPLSPASLAIARATGQLPGGSGISAQYGSNFPPQPPAPVWGYPDPFQHAQMFQFGVPGYPRGFVQPHINPRFASAFGMNLGLTQHLMQPAPPSNQTDEKVVLSGQSTTTIGGDVNSEK